MSYCFFSIAISIISLKITPNHFIFHFYINPLSTISLWFENLF